MPVQHDRQRGISQGWGSCRPPGHTEFMQCFIVLDRPKQLLICYKQSQSPSRNYQAEQVPWPVITQFSTDSISLVEEAHKIKNKCCFAIHSLAKITYFCAQSWRDMEEWIECIKDSSKISVHQSQLNPNRVSIIGSYTTEVVAGNVIQTPVLQCIEEGTFSTARDPSITSADSSSSDCLSPESFNNTLKPHEQALKSGYCVKQGAMMKSWKRRFLILTKDELMYFKNEFTNRPLRRISLIEVRDVKASNGELAGVRSNLMDLVTPDRTFYIQFDSIEEMFSWIEEIRRVANLSRSTYL